MACARRFELCNEAYEDYLNHLNKLVNLVPNQHNKQVNKRGPSSLPDPDDFDLPVEASIFDSERKTTSIYLLALDYKTRILEIDSLKDRLSYGMREKEVRTDLKKLFDKNWQLPPSRTLACDFDGIAGHPTSVILYSGNYFTSNRKNFFVKGNVIKDYDLSKLTADDFPLVDAYFVIEKLIEKIGRMVKAKNLTIRDEDDCKHIKNTLETITRHLAGKLTE